MFRHHGGKEVWVEFWVDIATPNDARQWKEVRGEGGKEKLQGKGGPMKPGGRTGVGGDQELW